MSCVNWESMRSYVAVALIELVAGQFLPFLYVSKSWWEILPVRSQTTLRIFEKSGNRHQFCLNLIDALNRSLLRLRLKHTQIFASTPPHLLSVGTTRRRGACLSVHCAEDTALIAGV